MIGLIFFLTVSVFGCVFFVATKMPKETMLPIPVSVSVIIVTMLMMIITKMSIGGMIIVGSIVLLLTTVTTYWNSGRRLNLIGFISGLAIVLSSIATIIATYHHSYTILIMPSVYIAVALLALDSVVIFYRTKRQKTAISI